MAAEEESVTGYLDGILSKLRTVVSRGMRTIEQIPQLIKQSQLDKLGSEQLESMLSGKRVLKRRYGTTQAGELAGISHTLIYAAEKDGRLPEPDMRTDTKKTTRAGYTINQINHIREVFNTAPSKPNTLSAAIIGLLNLKGGAQKTTHCHLFSQYLAIRGYKVLLVDTDPQGSLSFLMGKNPDVDVFYEHTMAPYLLDDEGALLEAGFEPGAHETLHYAIQDTYWSNIDIIPSCMQNLTIDLEMQSTLLAKGADVDGLELIEKLRRGLLGVAADYDFILIDGTPSLNFSTLNVVSACDMVFVPTPASMPDYASTLKFADLIGETIEMYKEQGLAPNMPDVRFFVSKYSRSSYAKFMGQIIRKVFSVEHGDVLSGESLQSDEVGKASNNITSIYEVNPSEADNRKRLKDTCESFDALFEEMHDAVWETCYEGFERESFTEKLDEILANDADVRKELTKEA